MSTRRAEWLAITSGTSTDARRRGSRRSPRRRAPRARSRALRAVRCRTRGTARLRRRCARRALPQSSSQRAIRRSAASDAREPRILHLHHDGLSARQARAVRLRDRRGAERLRVEPANARSSGVPSSLSTTARIRSNGSGGTRSRSAPSSAVTSAGSTSSRTAPNWPSFANAPLSRPARAPRGAPRAAGPRSEPLGARAEQPARGVAEREVELPSPQHREREHEQLRHAGRAQPLDAAQRRRGVGGERQRRRPGDGSRRECIGRDAPRRTLVAHAQAHRCDAPDAAVGGTGGDDVDGADHGRELRRGVEAASRRSCRLPPPARSRRYRHPPDTRPRRRTAAAAEAHDGLRRRDG